METPTDTRDRSTDVSESIHKSDHLDARVSSLETSVSAIHADVTEIKRLLSANSRTNWGVIMSGLLLVGSLWAAAIRPLQNDLERNERSAATVAQAVIIQDSKIGMQAVDLAKIQLNLDRQVEKFEEVRLNGSPATRERLLRIEVLQARQEEEHAARVTAERQDVLLQRLAELLATKKP
jgi:preprotein translocase subunit SecF